MTPPISAENSASLSDEEFVRAVAEAAASPGLARTQETVHELVKLMRERSNTMDEVLTLMVAALCTLAELEDLPEDGMPLLADLVRDKILGAHAFVVRMRSQNLTD